MFIIHLASIFTNKASGLSFSIPYLIEAQNTVNKEEIATLYNTKNGIKHADINFQNIDIFVLHSYFYPVYLNLLLSIPQTKKIILCPRGAFSKSNHYSIKKHIYSVLFFAIIKFRKLHLGIHFLTNNEQIRSRFHSKNEFVAGNTLPKIISNKLLTSEIVKSKYLSKKIVYIGRFSSHIKGLDLLFDSFYKNYDAILKNGFKFSFYGPETEDKKKLMDFSKRYNLTFVSFHNEIYGIKKEEVFKDAMFHILTSRSEGFPMAVLESCAWSTPQILSKGTNLMEMMLEHDFGFNFNDSLANNLNTLCLEEYSKLCVNARNFAQLHDFDTIGKKTLNYYKNI